MPVAVVDVLVLCVVSVGIAVVAWDPTLPNLAMSRAQDARAVACGYLHTAHSLAPTQDVQLATWALALAGVALAWFALAMSQRGAENLLSDHKLGWKEVWLFAGFLAVAVASVLHYHCHVHFQDLDRVASALAAAVGDVAFGVGACPSPKMT